MKKRLAILLAALTAAASLTACGGSGSSSNNSTQSSAAASAAAEQTTAAAPSAADSAKGSFDGRTDISYMMIYNPDTFDENATLNLTQNTGNLSEWVSPSSVRADDMQADAAYTTKAQQDLKEIVGDADLTDLPTDRAGGLIKTYKEGDTQSFFYNETKGSFTCLYAGNKCNVWMLPADISKKDQAIAIGKEFDANIYDKDVALFGEPRYADEGGKIQIIFEPMEGNLGGYFMPIELFTTPEALYLNLPTTGHNYDHAIIHINSVMLGKGQEVEKLIYSTMAHEFQHLINMSDLFYGNSGKITNTWLNEAMSGYAEEKIYPGSKESEYHDMALMVSERVRHGQSMYNFDNDGEDIGVYGMVYLFSEYLAKNGGEDIFKKIHNAYRTSITDIDDAKAIYDSMPAAFVSEIDAKYAYPASTVSGTKEQEWLSKLIMDFNLDLMAQAQSSFKRLDKNYLLYDQVAPAQLEGGGRIIAPTKSGTFAIPSDAGKPLAYIGLDKDYKPVTDVVYN